jgi:hypothetical protein
MKFLTLADWTGMVETELFAQTYKSYGLATVRYPVLEVTATVEPFENADSRCAYCRQENHERAWQMEVPAKGPLEIRFRLPLLRENVYVLCL